jgi:hypothetical protein
MQLFALVLLILTPDKYFSKNYKRTQTGKQVIEEEIANIKAYYSKQPTKRFSKNT